MKEYIEREALIEDLKSTGASKELVEAIVYRINQHPTADVAPVIHGEWIQIKEPLGWKDIDCVMCSACEDKWIMDEEYDLDFYKEQWVYCPFCGAKMDGGNK